VASLSSVSCVPTQSGSTVIQYAVCSQWACSAIPPSTWHPAICSRVPPEFTIPAGPHRDKAVPALLVQSPLASFDPLVACHPCQTTWAIKNHVFKQDGHLRIALSDQVGSKGSFCCTCPAAAIITSLSVSSQNLLLASCMTRLSLETMLC